MLLFILEENPWFPRDLEKLRPLVNIKGGKNFFSVYCSILTFGDLAIEYFKHVVSSTYLKYSHTWNNLRIKSFYFKTLFQKSIFLLNVAVGVVKSV